MATEEKQDVCSFCGLPSSEHRRLIQGDNCFICDVCVGICYQMINLGNNTNPIIDDVAIKEKDEEISLEKPETNVLKNIIEIKNIL